MNLADKPCYPITLSNFEEIKYSGLTFRERLIIALASNPSMSRVKLGEVPIEGEDDLAKVIIIQADAIIKQMEE